MKGSPLLIPIAFLGLAATGALLGLFIERSPGATADANSLSVSYVGHRALVEFLGECGFDVTVNRRELDPERPAKGRGLALLEPDPVEYRNNKALELARAYPGRRLLVLPKWRARKLRGNPLWASGRSLIDMGEIDDSSMARMAGGSAARVKGGVLSHRVDGAGEPMIIEIESLQHFTGVDPDRVILGCAGMALLVKDRRDPDLLILSDPDALGTGGLGLSENAVFAEEVFSAAFQDGAVLIDETHHGFVSRQSMTSAIFGYPGIVATLGAAAFLLLLFWSFSNDWGEGRALKQVEQSRLTQVRNAGRLMLANGRHAAGLSLFARNVQEALCERFHLDRSTGVEELAKFLVDRDPDLRAQADALVEALRSADATMNPAAVMSLAAPVQALLERGRHGIGDIDPRPGRI